MTRQENIATLTVHRNQLSSCHTFEDFKIQQIAFIDFLIETFTAEGIKEQRVTEILEQEGLL